MSSRVLICYFVLAGEPAVSAGLHSLRIDAEWLILRGGQEFWQDPLVPEGRLVSALSASSESVGVWFYKKEEEGKTWLSKIL